MALKLQKNLQRDEIMKERLRLFVFLLFVIFFINLALAEDITSAEKRAGGFCCISNNEKVICNQYGTAADCALNCNGNCEVGGCYKVDSCVSSVSFVTKYYWMAESKTTFIWFPVIEKSKDILGLREESKGAFFRSFFVGFFAGLLIWFIYFFIKIFRYFKESAEDNLSKRIFKKDKEEIVDSKTKWLYLVAGQFWKVILIGIGYWVLTQIPIINNFLKLITFELLGIPLMFQSIIVAFYIGFGPALIEYFLRFRKEAKYEKKVNEVIKGVSLSRAQSKKS